MITRRVRAWELIEEDDGSTTLAVEYEEGGREEFRGVTIDECGVVNGAVGQSIPLKIERLD
jgi:hypothetical protein